MSVIVALAGRRVDAEGAPPRFPLSNRDLVRSRIADTLRSLYASVLVAAGACGADLLAHQAARALGIRTRMVLPFDVARFRQTSVVDRPGDWGPLFDALCDAARQAGDLVVLPAAATDDSAYLAANGALLDDAAALAAHETPPAQVVALVVWDGARGAGDVTKDFADRAAERGAPVEEIRTT
jgi:hypothetical protein